MYQSTIDMVNNLLFASILSLLVFNAFLFLSNPLAVNRKGNLWLGLYILIWASFYMDEVALFEFGYMLNINVVFGLRVFQYFGPVTFFISMIMFTNPGRKLNKDIIWHSIPAVLYVGILFFYLFATDKSNTIRLMLLIFYLLQASVYIFLSLRLFRKHQRVLNIFSSNKEFIDLKWLIRLIVGIAVILLAVILSNLIFPFKSPTLLVNLLTIGVIFDFTYHAIKQKEIFPQVETITKNVISIDDELEMIESRNKLIDDSELVEMKAKLTGYMVEKQPFLDPEINLIRLAEQMNISAHKLSYIINAGYNINFFNFISQYRIEYAKKLITDENLNHLSLLGIAFESGFNSKTTFNNSFKRMTGMTPSEYKKNGSTL